MTFINFSFHLKISRRVSPGFVSGWFGYKVKGLNNGLAYPSLHESTRVYNITCLYFQFFLQPLQHEDVDIYTLFPGPTILIQHSFPKSNTRTLVYTLFLTSTILFQHEDVGTHVHSFPGSNKINATLFSYVQQGKFKGCRVKLNLKRSAH